MTALVSFERVFEVLDLVPMIQEGASAIAVPPGPAFIEFDEVSFRYPSAAEISLASLEYCRHTLIKDYRKMSYMILVFALIQANLWRWWGRPSGKDHYLASHSSVL